MRPGTCAPIFTSPPIGSIRPGADAAQTFFGSGLGSATIAVAPVVSTGRELKVRGT